MNTPTQNTEHTPGPWRFSGDYILSPTDTLIAVIGHEKLSDPVQAANGELLARAPDLLAENARLREALQMMVDAFNVETIDLLVAFVTIEKARAALAVERSEKV